MGPALVAAPEMTVPRPSTRRARATSQTPLAAARATNSRAARRELETPAPVRVDDESRTSTSREREGAPPIATRVPDTVAWDSLPAAARTDEPRSPRPGAGLAAAARDVVSPHVDPALVNEAAPAQSEPVAARPARDQARSRFMDVPRERAVDLPPATSSNETREVTAVPREPPSRARAEVSRDQNADPEPPPVNASYDPRPLAPAPAHVDAPVIEPSHEEQRPDVARAKPRSPGATLAQRDTSSHRADSVLAPDPAGASFAPGSLAEAELRAHPRSLQDDHVDILKADPLVPRDEASSRQDASRDLDPRPTERLALESAGLPAPLREPAAARPAKSPRTVKIHVGRIVIRAPSPPLRVQTPSKPAPRMSLSEYLKQRTGGRR